MFNKHHSISFFSWRHAFYQKLMAISSIVLLIGISFGYANWISFETGTNKTSVTEQDITRETAVSVSDMGCRVTVKFPGAFHYGPDHRDQHLLTGTTTLSLYGTPLGIVSGNLNGTFRPDKLGAPNLPYAHLQVLIPSSVTMDQLTIKVSNTNFKTLPGSFEIGPIQEDLPESYYIGIDKDPRAFQKNAKIYGTDAFFTHPLEHDIAILHGYKFVNIKYFPVKYNPVTKQLMVTNTADFEFSYKVKPTHNPMKPNMFTNLIYRSTIDGVTGKRSHSRVNLPRGGNFAIVSGGSLINSQTLKDYISWRESQGYKHLKTLDGTNGSSTTSELKSLYSGQNLDFVVVVGDDDVMQPPTDKGGDKYHYKNWSRLDGSDEQEDVCLSIFLCSDEAGMQKIVNRQKWHEAGGTWTTTFINTVGAKGSENPMARFSSGHYATRNFDKPDGGLGYIVKRVYQVKVIPTKGYGGKFNIPGPFPWEPWVDAQKPWYTSGSEAVDLIYKYWNEGAFMIQHRDHGSVSGPSKPAIRMDNSITTKASPFLLSVNCLSGNFKGKHGSNFAYKTQQQGEIGTSATLAAPPVTYSGDNDKYIMGLYAGMFPENGNPPDRQLGMSHVYAQKKGDSHSRTYMHIYGDCMTMLSIGDMEPFIKVVSPGNGSEVEQGSKVNVQWSDNISGNVKIELLKGGSVIETLAPNVPSNGSFAWDVPGSLATGDDYKIRVTSIDDPSLTHESEKPFKIIPEFIITKFPYTKDMNDLDTGKEDLPEKWEQLTDDDFNWLALSGPTPSKQYGTTGPDGDNSGSGVYIYLEASNPNNPNKKANFKTPKFKTKDMQNPTLSFYYHMFSDSNHMGELHLDIEVDGKLEKDVIALTDNDYGDKWIKAEKDLSNFKGDRVIFHFRGITGQSYASDICVDDFMVKDASTPVTDKIVQLPTSYDLKFYNSTIHYMIPKLGTNLSSYPVSIKLYNAQGKMVRSLVDRTVPVGHHTIKLDQKSQLANGFYQCILKVNNYIKKIDITIVK